VLYLILSQPLRSCLIFCFNTLTLQRKAHTSSIIWGLHSIRLEVNFRHFLSAVFLNSFVWWRHAMPSQCLHRINQWWYRTVAWTEAVDLCSPRQQLDRRLLLLELTHWMLMVPDGSCHNLLSYFWTQNLHGGWNPYCCYHSIKSFISEPHIEPVRDVSDLIIYCKKEGECVMFSYYEIALPVWVCWWLLWSGVSSLWTKRELILYTRPLFLNNTKHHTDWIFSSCSDAMTVNSTIFHCHKFRDPKTASLIDNVFTFRVRVEFGSGNRRHCELENAVERLRSMPTGMTDPDAYRCWT
jgi:hypothetical protein